MMADYLSDEDEDFFMSFMRSQFPFMTPSLADVLIRSSGDAERVRRWQETIGPVFNLLRYCQDLTVH